MMFRICIKSTALLSSGRVCGTRPACTIRMLVIPCYVKAGDQTAQAGGELRSLPLIRSTLNLVQSKKQRHLFHKLHELRDLSQLVIDSNVLASQIQLAVAQDLFSPDNLSQHWTQQSKCRG